MYLVELFDRFKDAAGRTQRSHIIDACQLLNKARSFKYNAASLETLSACIDQCRSKARARLQLFRWMLFNVLVGNDDNHLKNVSFTVSAEGIDLAPPYDMLSTAVYRTRAMANERARWPDVDLMIALPGAPTFGQVTRKSMLDAGALLGLPRKLAERELDSMTRALPLMLEKRVAQLEAENKHLPEAARPFLGGELRLIRAVQHVVVADMLKCVAK